MPDSSSMPQFGTAQYASQPDTDHCKFCGQPIGVRYFRTNDARCCEACAGKAFPRALLFGIAGAAIGLALYAGFVIITDIEIGYASLAVGFIVAKAMLIGSKGVGGRRYQITAALLTYAAVSFSFIPIFLFSTHIPFGSAPLLKLIELAVRAPFLEMESNPAGGIIGLIILFVGMSIAWRMTAGKTRGELLGPYDAQGASAS